MEEGEPPTNGTELERKEDRSVQYTYPIVYLSDWPGELWEEMLEMATTACEKFPNNHDLAAKSVKQQLDQGFIAPWNVVVGESFGYEVNHVVGTVMIMLCCGTTAVMIWKAPSA